MTRFNHYFSFIDPLLKKAHLTAAMQVKTGEKIIDIACGNGTVPILYSNVAERVTAIDLNDTMIKFAKHRSVKSGITNIDFICMDALQLDCFSDKEFDVASISMAIHQFNYFHAFHVLQEAKRIAKEIIIVDYQYPLPSGFSGLVTRMIERIAGKEHHKNFLAYLKMGGIPAYCKEAGLNIISPLNNMSVFTVIRVAPD